MDKHMNTKNDSLLTSLLQYHTRLVDQQFVDNIISNIKAKNKLRVQIIIMAILIACSVTIPLIVNITEEFDFLSSMPALSPYLITFFLLSVLGFGAWLTNEDF